MDFEPINGQRQTCAHYHWGKSTYVDNGMNPDHGYIGNVSPITVTTHGTYSDNPTTAELSAPYRFTGNWIVLFRLRTSSAPTAIAITCGRTPLSRNISAAT